jgi:hypothetical protein
MNKIFYFSFLLCVSFLSANAQNGGGCSKAITINAGVYIVDSMVAGAASFANISPSPTKAKWYKYTPTQDGLLNITSCGGGADTRIFMYAGNCTTLSLFGYNDDYCFSTPTGREEASDISKFVKAGTTYYFEWDNAWEQQVDVPFSFVMTFTPTANVVANETQTCRTAKNIVTGTIKVDSLFGYATKGDASRANWYKFIPRSNGKITVSACGVDVDTRLWVYKGSCDALSAVAESDDDCDGANLPDLAASIQNVPVTANTVYYLEWDDTYENNPFDFVLQFDATSAVDDPQLSKSISLAPNPASDYVDLNFNFEKNTHINLSIYNTVGQLVVSKKMTDILRGSEKLDITALKSGLYIVKITEGDRQTNKKLVISR